MSHILRSITRLYEKLVELFPPKFREEFGEELQVVFSAMVSDASEKGKLALAVTCIKELRDFPILLVRSHMEEKTMLKMVSSQPVRFAFRGALGFGLGLACTRAFSLVIVYWLSTTYYMDAGWSHVLAVFFGYGVAALSGGLLFALLFGKRTQFGWYALIGTMGWFIPGAILYVLTMSMYEYYYSWLQVGQIIIPNAGIALWGVFLSMMLCVAESKRRVFLWPLIVTATLFPILSYIFQQYLFHFQQYLFQGNHPLSISLIFILVLMALFIAYAMFLAIKSDRRSLWAVIAGTLSFPIIFYLCEDMFSRFHLFLQSSTNSLNTGVVINTVTISIPEGILFGMIISLIFGWQKRFSKVDA